jgi:hypothetical protein
MLKNISNFQFLMGVSIPSITLLVRMLVVSAALHNGSLRAGMFHDGLLRAGKPF